MAISKVVVQCLFVTAAGRRDPRAGARKLVLALPRTVAAGENARVFWSFLLVACATRPGAHHFQIACLFVTTAAAGRRDPRAGVS